MNYVFIQISVIRNRMGLQKIPKEEIRTYGVKRNSY